MGYLWFLSFPHCWYHLQVAYSLPYILSPPGRARNRIMFLHQLNVFYKLLFIFLSVIMVLWVVRRQTLILGDTYRSVWSEVSGWLQLSFK